MDLGSSLHQSSYGISCSAKITSPRIRFRAKNLNFVGDSRVLRKPCSLKRDRAQRVGILLPLSSDLCRFHARCQLVDGSNQNAEVGGSGSVEEEKDGELELDDLRELLQKTRKELEVARLNSTMFEEKAQRISESAIALKDEAESAWRDVTEAVGTVQEIIGEETIAKEAVQRATMALSMAEARLPVAMETGEGEILLVQEEIKEWKASLEKFEAELRRTVFKKEELQKEVDRLNEMAEKAQLDALKAEEDVANIMLLTEQAVAYEVEATQRVNDAELALQKAVASSQEEIASEESNAEEEVGFGEAGDVIVGKNEEVQVSDKLLGADVVGQNGEEAGLSDDVHGQENGRLSFEKEDEVEVDKSKNVYQQKKQDKQQKEFAKDSPLSSPKALLKKSSRFFSASFFSSNAEEEEYTPVSVFHGFITSARKQVPKLILGAVLIGMG